MLYLAEVKKIIPGLAVGQRYLNCKPIAKKEADKFGARFKMK